MTKLEKFLNNRGLLEQFEYNVHHHSSAGELPSYYYKHKNIISAFCWSDTKEGAMFWSATNQEWIKCLRYNML